MTIAGQRYAVRTDSDETYVAQLAAYVDAKMREVRRATRLVPTHSVAILAALQIADELQRERRSRGELRREVRERSRAILRYLEREIRR